MGEDFSLNLNGKDYLIKKKDVKDDTKLSKDDLEIEKNSVEESIFNEFQLEKGANGVGGDDSIFDAGEINTFINRMDTEVDRDNDGKLSDGEITDFMEDTFGNKTDIDSRAVNGFKSFFASLSTAINGTQSADSTNGTGNTADVQGVKLQYDDSKPGILQDETDTNRPNDVYVEVQKWGDEPLEGNKNANDCLSRVIENYYGVNMSDREYEAIEKAIMDYNPEIYGGEGQGIEDAGEHYNVRGTAVNDNRIYPTGDDRHNAILYSEDYNPLREDGKADRIYLPGEIDTSPEEPADNNDNGGGSSVNNNNNNNDGGGNSVNNNDNNNDGGESSVNNNDNNNDGGGSSQEEDPYAGNTYWKEQSEIMANAINAVYSDEKIKDYTNENLDSPLAGKEDKLRDFLNGIAPNRAGSSDDEQTARDNTKTNAEAFSALYQKSYDEWTLKGYFGTDIDVDAMGEAIRTYIDQVAPNKGDYKGSIEATQEGYNDNSFHDDYKYGFSGDVEESPDTFWDENEDYVAQKNYDDFVADHDPVKTKTKS